MKTCSQKIILAVIASSLIVSIARAGSVAGTGGATEMTQTLNNLELLQQSAQMIRQLEQTIQQVKMMEQQLKNLIQAPEMVWGQTQNELTQLTQLVSKGQALGYQLGNIEQTFATQFPGYTAPLKSNYLTESRVWIQKSLDSIRSALEVAGMQSNQFVTEQAAMKQIQSIAAAAPGSLQATQAGIMVASQQVEQLQKLRQLYMSQMQAQNAYLSKQEQQQANDRSTMDFHFRQYTGSAPTFRSSGGRN